MVFKKTIIALKSCWNSKHGLIVVILTMFVLLSCGQKATVNPIIVIPVKKNSSPRFQTGSASVSTSPGRNFQLKLLATDPDSDALYYEVLRAPSGLVLFGSTIEWTPTAKDAGAYQISTMVSDNRGGSDTFSLLLTVALTPTYVDSIAPFSPRDFAQCASFLNRLWIIGGNNYGQLKDVWFTGNGIDWTRAADNISFLPGQALVCRSSLYYISTGGDGLPSVWTTNDGSTWQQLPQTKGFMGSSYALACFNDKLWAVGVQTGGYPNSVWSSTDGMAWECVTKDAGFPVSQSFKCVATGSGMFAIGAGPSETRRGIWRSDDGVTWEMVADSITCLASRKYFQCVVFDGNIWVATEESEAYEKENELWTSADGKIWTQCESRMPFSTRYGCAVAAYAGRLWFIGGQDVWLDYYNDVWSLQ
jgi:hypothetical protein